MSDWYDDDTFWNLMAPFFFNEARWEGAALEIDLIENLVPLGPESAVLDLACGPGRHSLELARRGHQVTGVDRTRSYLRQARYRAAGEGLNVAFVDRDMREFRQPDSFDAALNLFTSFGYFADPAENALVLQNIFDSLRDGGVFVLETLGKEVLARIFQPRNWNDQDGVYWLEEREVERDWSWMKLHWVLISPEERRELDLGHWLYSAAELRGMLREAGFSEIAFYGDLAGRPYDREAGRLVAVARK